MNFSAIAQLKGLNSGANPRQALAVEQQLGIMLPKEYADFMFFSNGCLLENGLCIYPFEDVVERNQTFEVSEYVRGYVLIGDDSGGTGILLSLDPTNKKIYTSGLGDLNPLDLKEVSNSFQLWINSNFAL